MTIKVKPISSQLLDEFYGKFKEEKTFLQSEKYGRFRSELGENISYFGLFEDEKLIGTALIQKITTRLKTFGHCPHGPLILSAYTQAAWDVFLDFYKKFGKENQCDFVRISPLCDPTSQPLFKHHKFQAAPVHLVNPEKTWILDITPDEEALLAQMKKSTRYEVRQIEKKGLTVKQGNSAEDLDIFWELHRETVARQKFVPFPKKNTEIEIQTFSEDCQIFSTKVENDYLSSSVILFDDQSAYYHQGASQYSKLPVAHATIWAAIKEAKKRGCQTFNFWGIVDDEAKKHPWYGLSRFKRGFGGEEHNYLHCQDYPLTWKYTLNTFIEKYRRWKRGY